ncbi:MAG: transglutaminase domain-containing protein [Pseudomonadales bacterium]|nr:transglutaminase domain-containing protein [Pseudomonadales bacterium]
MLSEIFTPSKSQAKLTLAFIIALLANTSVLATVSDKHKRVVHFTYSTEIGPIETNSGPVHVFIPLPVKNEQQNVLEEKISASIPGEVEVEDAYGNRYWHGYLEAANQLPIRISVDVTVERAGAELAEPVASTALGLQERNAFKQYLKPNNLVLVGAPILDPIRAEIHQRVNSDDPARIARGIYDWVVENVEYKKVGNGWGNGDTYWACTERYGNCTDFHALFISLARSEGIPARFEIGFPLPDDRPAGQVGGYHCWVQFYLPETGWFPIDASEAFKHPELKEYFYGAHPTNRIHFSTGRDLTLGEAQQAQPLNYFIYPHVEVGGKPYTGTISKRFSYRAPGDPASVAVVKAAPK